MALTRRAGRAPGRVHLDGGRGHHVDCGGGASLIYVPEFVRRADSHITADSINAELSFPEERDIILFGHTQPRDVIWQGEFSYGYSKLKLRRTAMTPQVRSLHDLVQSATGYRWDGVLINRYQSGADSIAAHSDDEAELGENPVVVAISLGATRTMIFRRRKVNTDHLSGGGGVAESEAPSPNVSRVSVDLRDGSVMIMLGSFQRLWTHEIPKEPRVKGSRISLTFRRSRALVAAEGNAYTFDFPGLPPKPTLVSDLIVRSSASTARDEHGSSSIASFFRESNPAAGASSIDDAAVVVSTVSGAATHELAGRKRPRSPAPSSEVIVISSSSDDDV